MAFDILGYYNKFKDFYGEVPIEEVAKDVYTRGGFDKEYDNFDSWVKQEGIEQHLQRPKEESAPARIAKAFLQGAAEGVTTELPSMVGGALGFAASHTPFKGIQETGKSLKEWAEEKRQELYGPEIERTGLERIVYEGTKMLAPSILPYGVVGTVARGLKGVNALTKAGRIAEATAAAKSATNIASGSVAGLFGLSQAQQTKDTAIEAGVDPGFAPYLTGALDAAGEFLGTKYLAKLFRLVEAEVVKRGGKEFVKDLLKTIGVEVGTEMGQSGGEAAVEKYSGIRPTASPIGEAIDVIGPTTFMTLLTAGLAGGANKLRETKEDPEGADYLEKLKIGAIASMSIKEGLQTGKLDGDPFTPENALEIIREGQKAGIYDDDSIERFKERYPQLRDGLNGVIAERFAEKVEQEVLGPKKIIPVTNTETDVPDFQEPEEGSLSGAPVVPQKPKGPEGPAGAAVTLEGGDQNGPLQTETAISGNNLESKKTGKVYFKDDISPYAVSVLWEDARSEADGIAERNKAIIESLKTEKSSIPKGDRSGRKKAIDDEIKKLNEEISVAYAAAEESFNSAADDYAKRILKRAKDEGIAVEENDVYETISALSNGRVHDVNGGKTWTEPLADQVLRELRAIAKERTGAASPAAEVTEKIPEGYLARGTREGGLVLGQGGGVWATDSIENAKSFGDKIEYVKKPEKILEGQDPVSLANSFRQEGDKLESVDELTEDDWTKIKDYARSKGYDAINFGPMHMDNANDIWIIGDEEPTGVPVKPKPKAPQGPAGATASLESPSAKGSNEIKELAGGAAPVAPLRPVAKDESGPAPIPPLGKGWTSDRGAIPGEPGLVYKDKAAIIERVDDQGMVLYEAATDEGQSLGIFEDITEAKKAAEYYVDNLATTTPTEATEAQAPAIPKTPKSGKVEAAGNVEHDRSEAKRNIKLLIKKIKGMPNHKRASVAAGSYYDSIKNYVNDLRNKYGGIDDETIAVLRSSGLYDDAYLKEIIPEYRGQDNSGAADASAESTIPQATKSLGARPKQSIEETHKFKAGDTVQAPEMDSANQYTGKYVYRKIKEITDFQGVETAVLDNGWVIPVSHLKAVEPPAQGEKEKTIAGPPSFNEMVKEAQRWRGAAYKVDAALGNDFNARLAHSKMTTKADLDHYLMKKFGIDAATARDVSNELTAKDLKPDMTANVEDFSGEPWAKLPSAPKQGSGKEEARSQEGSGIFDKDITGNPFNFRPSNYTDEKSKRQHHAMKAVDKNREIVHGKLTKLADAERAKDKEKAIAALKEAIDLAEKSNAVNEVFTKEFGEYRVPFNIKLMRAKLSKMESDLRTETTEKNNSATTAATSATQTFEIGDYVKPKPGSGLHPRAGGRVTHVIVDDGRQKIKTENTGNRHFYSDDFEPAQKPAETHKYKAGDKVIVSWGKGKDAIEYPATVEAAGENRLVVRADMTINEIREKGVPDGAREVLVDEVKPAPVTKPISIEVAKNEAPAYGSQNKLVTKDEMEEASRILKEALSGINMGVPLSPQVVQAGIKIAVYHIEAGSRTFAAYASKMIEGFGDAVRPYLKQFYMAAKYQPGLDSTGMDNEAALDAIDENVVTLEDKKAIFQSLQKDDMVYYNKGDRASSGYFRKNNGGYITVVSGGGLTTEVFPDDFIRAERNGKAIKPLTSKTEDVNIITKGGQNEHSADGSTGTGTLESNKPGNLPADGRGQRPGSGKRGGRKADNERDESPDADRDDETGSLAGKPAPIHLSDEGSAGGGVSAGTGREGEGNTEGLVENDQSTPASEPRTRQLTGVNPGNYRITEADNIGEGTRGQKIDANLAAIRLIKQLDKEGRYPTKEEQSVLAKYVGWGGLKSVFDKDSSKAQDQRARAELESLLTKEEYLEAFVSMTNAHYTSPQIIKSIYKILKHFGLTGGNILEPTYGVGNFIGLAPEDIAAASKFYGSELDIITAKIGQYLYPDSQLIQSGFQNAEFPYGKFDAFVGNPPFGDERIADTRKSRQEINRFKIHNYCIAKSGLHLKPGGIGAAVVTSRFLDTADSEARDFLSKNFKFLGAIRLPNDAFAKNAGTEVTTDLVFLQRLMPDETADFLNNDWLETGATMTNKDGETITLNRYFANRPHLMIGEPSMKGTMYGGAWKEGGRGEFTLNKREGVDIEEAIDKIIREDFFDLKDIMRERAGDKLDAAALSLDVNKEDVGIGGFFMDGNKIYMRGDNDEHENPTYSLLTPKTPWTEKSELGQKRYDRIKGMLGLRTKTYELINAERFDLPNIEELRKELNKQYDYFVKEHGFLSEAANFSLMSDDIKIEFGLESDFKKEITKARAKNLGIEPAPASAEKSGILKQRMFYPEKEILYAKDATDGYNISLSQRGRLDLDYIAQLTGQPKESVINELSEGGLIYQDPETNEWIQEDEYLSGNVKAKFKKVDGKAGFEKNAAALKKVFPKDVTADEIFANPGATWIPTSIYERFGQFIGLKSPRATIYKDTGHFNLLAEGQELNDINVSWENDYFGFGEIFNAVANNKPLIAYDGHGDDRQQNKDATKALADISESVRQTFFDWAFAEEERARELTKIYNDTQNTTIERKNDGSRLTMVGASPAVVLRNTQRNGAWRMIQNKHVLLDHCVGAGKTFTIIAGIMERVRMGLTNKAMIAVPNHLVGQWAADFMKLYPGARILAATKKDFQKSNRRRLFARIATGKYDAIIVGHSSFGFIPIERESLTNLIMEEIEHLERAHDQASQEGNKRLIKSLAKRIQKKREKIQELMGRERDNVTTFEAMGIDHLVIDESHEFKNLEYSSAMQNITGMGNPMGSKRAFDLYSKIRWLNTQKNYAVTFATGTPISNSLVEMYALFRYMNRQALIDRGLEAFDAWANAYAKIESRIEYTASQKLKDRTVMAKFNNLPEMLQVYKEFADVITMNDLKRIYAEQIRERNLRTGGNESEDFPIPKIEEDGRVLDVADATEEQIEYVDYLVARVERMEKLGRDNDPKIDNHLWVMSDARKMALDIRLVDPKAADNPNNKINRSAKKIKEIFDATTKDRGTQLVFCDLSTPSGSARKNADKFIRDALKIAGLEKDIPTKTILDTLRSYQEKWGYIRNRIEAEIESIDDHHLGETEQYAKRREQLEEYLEKITDDVTADLTTADTGFSVYDELKSKLIDMGIPEGEIKFIHEANADAQKQELFDLVNAGKVRILMGSSPKMGAGMNAQERLVALHHLDAPWRPSDVEQREGRIVRQGNKLYEADPKGFKVRLIAYSTKNTFDAVMWQILARKGAMLDDFRSGKRSCEDASTDSASFADFMAESTGNPAYKEKHQLENEIRILEDRKRKTQVRLRSAKQTLEYNKDAREKTKEAVSRREALIALLKGNETFTYKGVEYDGNINKIVEEERDRIREQNIKALEEYDQKIDVAREEAFKDLDTKAWIKPSVPRSFKSENPKEWEAYEEAKAEYAAFWENEENQKKFKAAIKGIKRPSQKSVDFDKLAKSHKNLAAVAEMAKDVNALDVGDTFSFKIGDAQIEIHKTESGWTDKKSTDAAQLYDYSITGNGVYLSSVRAALSFSKKEMSYAVNTAYLIGKTEALVHAGNTSLRDMDIADKNAQVTLDNLQFKDEEALQAKKARFDEVLAIVAEADAEIMERRLAFPSKYIKKDRKRFGDGTDVMDEVIRKEAAYRARTDQARVAEPTETLNHASLKSLLDQLAGKLKGIAVEEKDGVLQIRTRGGNVVQVYQAEMISVDEIVLQVGYGRSDATGGRITGKFTRQGEKREITLRRDAAGLWTLSHEFVHFLESIGAITSEEQSILDKKIAWLIKRDPENYGFLAKRSAAERRAEYLGRAVVGAYDATTFTGKILQKIKDIIDAVVNAFGIRTAAGVIRDIKSGSIYEREATEAADNLVSYSLNRTPPKKSIVAYKLFRTLKGAPGQIFPLFIGKNIPTPVGEWVSAEFLPTKGFAYRPGWHVGRMPKADHLMKKDGTLPSDRVWAEVEIPADVNWQGEADKRPTRDIQNQVPEGGHYRFKRPSNQGGEWLIAGSMKVNRVLSEKEVDAILTGGQTANDEHYSFEEDLPKSKDPKVLNRYLKDETDAFVQTMMNKLQPKHMTWLETMLKSPEWFDHPQIQAITKIFMRDRNEIYHETFNNLNLADDMDTEQETISEAAKALKNKGLTLAERFAGKVSPEYQRLQEIIDEGDTSWKRNTSIPLDQQIKEFERHIRRQGATEDTIRVWKLYRQSYDKALDLMTAQLRRMIEEITEEANLRGEKPDLSELSQTLKGALAQMKEWKGFYAPRLREMGNWKVQAYKEHGPMKENREWYREHRGSELSARRLAQRLQREGWKIHSVGEVEKLPEAVYQDVNAVATAKLIDNALEKLSKKSSLGDKAMKLNEEVLRAVSDEIKARGFRSTMIHRGRGNVVRGFIEDPIQRHLQYINNVSGGIAKARSAKMAMKELHGEIVMGKRVGGIDPTKDPEAYRVATNYIEEQLRNAEPIDRMIGLAKSIATFKFLGFNLRSLAVNTTAIVTTAPAAIYQYALGGKGSLMGIIKALGVAGKDYGAYMAGKAPSDKWEQAFLNEITKLGWDDAQYTREALGEISKTHSRVWSSMMDASMYLFGKSEQWNRGTTMLAAYRLARKQGMNHIHASEAAKNASDKAHGVYGKSTMPMWAMGTNPAAKIGQMFYVYQKFGHNYLQMLYDMGAKKHNIKGLMFATLSPLVLAGAAAAPLKEVFLAMFAPLFRLLFDDDRDPEKWVWDEIRKHLGAEAEKIGRHGLTGAMGVDISSSLSAGVGIPKNFIDLTGAIGGVATEIVEAKESIRNKQYGRAAEHLLPTGFANPLRAMREAQEGVTTKNNRRIWDEQGRLYKPSPGATLARAFGFRSADQAVLSERTWEGHRQQAHFAEMRDKIYERYRAWMLGKRDREEYREIVKEIQEYNRMAKGKPGVSQITMQSLQNQARRMAAPSKADREILRQ